MIQKFSPLRHGGTEFFIKASSVSLCLSGLLFSNEVK